jgi:hypothetical protein
VAPGKRPISSVPQTTCDTRDKIRALFSRRGLRGYGTKVTEQQAEMCRRRDQEGRYN